MKKTVLFISLTVLIITTLLTVAGCGKKKETKLVEELAISLTDTSRVFSFTNKKYGQYFGRTNAYFTDDVNMGWTFREHRIFNEYSLNVNGKPEDRKRAKTVIFPHMMRREYADGMQEEFFFADSLDLVVLTFKKIPDGRHELKLTGLPKGTSSSLSGEIVSINGMAEGYNLYVMADNGIGRVQNVDSSTVSISLKGDNSISLVFAVSKNIPGLKSLLESYEELKYKKAARIEKMLLASAVHTNNAEFDKALMWAKVSLDALITTQDMKGIFAGLPWFNNYWGRDTFISLPGAALVTGNYSDTRDILLEFAKHQDINSASRYFGRIPNRITLNETIYNTADATPRFVIESYNYFNYSDDQEFLQKIYPAVRTAFEGAVKNNVDENGFLTHGDAETWMDAVGKNGPWSPRGNRAVDIQALWYRQLISTSEIAHIMNDLSLQKSALALAGKMALNFEKFFVDKEREIIYDHITASGQKDPSLRANVFFALNEPEIFSSALLRLKIMGNITDKLVMPYGVLSLSNQHPNFHPFHKEPGKYENDAAYHNGTIWQWLTGPVVQALCGFGRQDLAWMLTKELTHQILNRGAVGSIAELMDAVPRPGQKVPALSGTFSQAWSLSEYIRSIYQDYLGVKPDATHKALYLLPTMPAELKNVEFSQKIGKDIVKLKYTFNENVCRIDVDASGVKDNLDLGVAIMNSADANFQIKTSVRKGDNMSIQVPARSNSLRDLKVYRNGEIIRVASQLYNDPPENARYFERIKFIGQK